MKLKLKGKTAEQIYITSDWHLYHNNVLRFDNRPHNDMQHMIDDIRTKLSHLTRDDILIVLGDLFMPSNRNAISIAGQKEVFTDFMKSIQANVYLVYGNHDGAIINDGKLRSLFTSIYQGYCELSVGSRDLHHRAVLSHYPLYEWNSGHRGVYHFFGHTHGRDLANPRIMTHKVLNVGCMLHDYRPVRFSDAIQYLAGRADIDHQSEDNEVYYPDIQEVM